MSFNCVRCSESPEVRYTMLYYSVGRHDSSAAKNRGNDMRDFNRPRYIVGKHSGGGLSNKYWYRKPSSARYEIFAVVVPGMVGLTKTKILSSPVVSMSTVMPLAAVALAVTAGWLVA